MQPVFHTQTCCVFAYEVELRLKEYGPHFPLFTVAAAADHTLFGTMEGLAWSHDPESYAGGSVPTGRVSHAGPTVLLIQTS
jgi:hypothetical protein